MAKEDSKMLEVRRIGKRATKGSESNRNRDKTRQTDGQEWKQNKQLEELKRIQMVTFISARQRNRT